MSIDMRVFVGLNIRCLRDMFDFGCVVLTVWVGEVMLWSKGTKIIGL